MATKQILFGGCDVTPTVSATRYGGLTANAFSASEPSQSGIVSTPGKLTNWQVKLNTAPGAGKSWVFTVRLNGADTALSVTIADTATASSVDASEVTIAAGDLVGFSSAPSGTPADALSIKWSCEFIPDTAGHTLFLTSSNGTNLADGQFTAISCPKSPDATEFDAQVIFPTAGKLKNFYVNLVTAPGSGKSRTFTVRLNGSTSGQISLAIANTATTGNETATEITIAAGDSVAILDTDSNTPAASPARFGLTFIPTTSGEFVSFATTDDNLNSGATEYQFLSCSDSTLSNTEADFECLSVSDVTAKKLYVKLSTDPGTNPDGYTFTLKKNGSDTSLAVSIVADNTTGNAASDVSVSAGDLLYYSIRPDSTPSATPHTQLGLLLYIAPTGGAYTLTASAGTFTKTGQTAGLLAARKISISAGTFTESGQAVGLLTARKISISAGAFAESGQAVGLLAARKISISAGAFAESGQAVGLLTARKISISAGAFAESGQAVGLLTARKISLSAGTFTETGQETGLLAARKISAEQGTFTLSGIDANLIYAPSGGYILSAGTGVFALTGNNVNTTAARKISIGYGVFTYTGTAANLTLSAAIGNSKKIGYSGKQSTFKSPSTKTFESGKPALGTSP